MPLFFCFTIDTSTEFLFGEKVGALDAVEKKMGDGSSPPAMEGAANEDGDHDGAMAASQEFSDALRVAGDGTLMRIRLASVYWMADGLKFRRAIRTIWRFVDGFVDKALARAEAQSGGKEAIEGKADEHGLLGALVAQTKEREDLISQSLGMLMFAFVKM